VILFLTNSTEEALPESVRANIHGVDAVTSASKVSMLEEWVDQLVELLAKRL